MRISFNLKRVCKTISRDLIFRAKTNTALMNFMVTVQIQLPSCAGCATTGHVLCDIVMMSQTQRMSFLSLVLSSRLTLPAQHFPSNRRICLASALLPSLGSGSGLFRSKDQLYWTNGGDSESGDAVIWEGKLTCENEELMLSSWATKTNEEGNDDRMILMSLHTPYDDASKPDEMPPGSVLHSIYTGSRTYGACQVWLS